MKKDLQSEKNGRREMMIKYSGGENTAEEYETRFGRRYL